MYDNSLVLCLQGGVCPLSANPTPQKNLSIIQLTQLGRTWIARLCWLTLSKISHKGHISFPLMWTWTRWIRQTFGKLNTWKIAPSTILKCRRATSSGLKNHLVRETQKMKEKKLCLICSILWLNGWNTVILLEDGATQVLDLVSAQLVNIAWAFCYFVHCWEMKEINTPNLAKHNYHFDYSAPITRWHFYFLILKITLL